MDLIFASANHHKREELAELFHGHRILSPEDCGIRFHHEETGESFFENALGKARTARGLLESAGRRTPVLADDSGLVVPALGGEPGIYSARYGSRADGGNLSAAERNSFLLGRMRGIRDRSAFFVCSMVLLFDEDRFYAAQETLAGYLLEEPRGSGGFGYDPLLFLPDLRRSVAELSAAEKNRLSHRGKAARALSAILRSELQ